MIFLSSLTFESAISPTRSLLFCDGLFGVYLTPGTLLQSTTLVVLPSESLTVLPTLMIVPSDNLQIDPPLNIFIFRKKQISKSFFINNHVCNFFMCPLANRNTNPDVSYKVQILEL